jgi:hypothetical protein
MSYHVPVTASFVSILTLTVLSVERYHAVVKPMRTGIRLREDTVKHAIIAVWFCSIALTFPYYVYSYYDTDRCIFAVSLHKVLISIYFLIAMAIFLFFIPFFIITFCYFQIVRELYFKTKVGPQNIAAQEEARSKRKLVKLSLSITIAFVVCFFPMFITLILSAYDKETFPVKAYQVASIFYFLGSAINPLLYAFQSTNFRQVFKEMLLCRHEE